MTTTNDSIKARHPDKDINQGKKTLFEELTPGQPFTQTSVYNALAAALPDQEARTFNDLLRQRVLNSITPVIDQEPQDQTVTVGSTPTFTVGAGVESGTVNFQWQTNIGAGFVDLPTETNASLTLPPVGLINNGNLFRVRVTANNRSALSRAASLTVNLL